MLETTSVFFDFFEKNYAILVVDAVEISDGNERVFRIQTIDNQRFTFKIYRSADAPNAARLAEIGQFLRGLAATKIVVPMPVLTVKQTVVSTIFFENKQADAALFRWIDGTNIARTTANFYKKMGELTANLHLFSCDFEEKQPIENAKSALTILDENYVRAIQNWLPATLAEHGFSAENERVFTKKLTSLAEFLQKWKAENPADFGRIHTDLHLGNVLCKNQKLAIIDWDCLAFGPFLLDFGIFFKSFETVSAEKQTYFKNIFLKEYQKIRLLETDFEVKFESASRLANLLVASWVFDVKNDFVRKNLVFLNTGKRAISAILND